MYAYLAISFQLKSGRFRKENSWAGRLYQGLPSWVGKAVKWREATRKETILELALEILTKLCTHFGASRADFHALYTYRFNWLI
jgi:hypothetical protein